LRTTIPDGGVDTRVESPIINDPTGWLNVKSIWQYKATRAGSVTLPSLRQEVNKEHAANCISQGYAYRFCICDEVADEKKERWEVKLTEYAREINNDAPPSLVLTASDLAVWANQFPSLVMELFRPGLASIALHLDSWRANITNETPIYIPVAEWQDISERIRTHVNLTAAPMDVVLTIQAEAGVGKTRLTFESLALLEGSKRLVVYTQDEQGARQIANRFANDNRVRAILVADECSVHSRQILKETLRGCAGRVRVIAIDNSGERLASVVGEYRLERMQDEVVNVILERNFPDVPSERRRLYTELSGRFVRLAADMCRYDPLISARGELDAALQNVSSYYRYRLSQEQREVVEAIALVTRVGFKNEVSQELDYLCGFLGLDSQRIKITANSIHDGPGFVGKGGRFYYVTPEIIARVAFQFAWDRWAVDNPQQFLRNMPGEILELFLGRVAQSASEEVRRLVGGFFRQWVGSLEPTQLTHDREVDRLVALADMDPATYFTLIRQLVEDSTLEELLNIKGEGVGRWGTRRHLVWLVERLAAFPEYFEDAERILLRLALTESEPNIGNNATSIWKQLFRIQLSGSALPFLDRLSKLEERIYSDDQQTSQLAMEAMDGIFHQYGHRMLGPKIVAGRIVPADWSPRSDAEYRQCIDAAVSILHKLVLNGAEYFSIRATDIAIKHMRTLLHSGYFNEIRDFFSDVTIPNKTRTSLISSLEEVLHYDCRPESAKPCPPPDYVQGIQNWLEELLPTDMHGKIIAVAGRNPWHARRVGKEESWKAQMKSIAKTLKENPRVLEEEMEWLCSEEAKSAVVLGQEVGVLDSEADFLNTVLEASLENRSSGFGRGYIMGLLDVWPKHSDLLNQFIDELQERDASLAYDLYIAGGDITRALDRTLRLYDETKLNVRYLRIFETGVGSRMLTKEEFEAVLERLIFAIQREEAGAREIAIEFVAYRLVDDKQRDTDRIVEHKRIRKLIWHLVELTAESAEGESHWWGSILKSLISVDPARVARIASIALVSDAYGHSDVAEEVLSQIASENPTICMEEIGKMILDTEKGWRFFVRKYTAIFQGLPEDVVAEWVRANGVEAARGVARHLPAPSLDAEGNPNVPHITEFVLREFEDDDRVFNEFCAGMHSFELYSGDIAAQHEEEARIAEKFLGHPLRRIREWAHLERENALHQAKQWRQRNEEFGLL
jgi:hypothetical protein